MKLFIYRTFTWTTIGFVACLTSFVAGVFTREWADIKKDVEKKTNTEDHLPK